MKVPFFNPSPMHESIDNELKRSLLSTYESNWYVLGERLKKFEKLYADFSTTKFALGVSNGLDALILSLKSLGIRENDEVILPSNTYIATVIAVSNVGAKPVFVEPNIKTYNIDPEKIEEKINNRTKAIIPVHLYGLACEMTEIKKIADKYGLFIVEDNAQAHGAFHNDKITGSWGDVNATSFYPTKNLGCFGDGGAITTDNYKLKDKIFSLRNYGSKIKYINDDIGFNMRLDEIQADVLRIKLKKINEWNKLRSNIAKKYDSALNGVGDIILPYLNKNSSHVFHLFVIRTNYRDQLNEFLVSNGVGTSIHYPIPPFLQKAYRFLNLKKGELPISEELASTSISLPIWPGIKDCEIELIHSKIKEFFNE